MVILGLVLIVIAVSLILAEAHLSTGGLIAGGALIALISGLTLLLRSAGASLLVLLLVGCCAIAASAACLLVARRSLRSVRRQRPRSGPEAMVGHVGILRARDSAIRVFVDGALWRAQPNLLEDPGDLHDGDRVVVERVNGLTLGIRKAEQWELSP